MLWSAVHQCQRTVRRSLKVSRIERSDRRERNLAPHSPVHATWDSVEQHCSRSGTLVNACGGESSNDAIVLAKQEVIELRAPKPRSIQIRMLSVHVHLRHTVEESHAVGINQEVSLPMQQNPKKSFDFLSGQAMILHVLAEGMPSW